MAWAGGGLRPLHLPREADAQASGVLMGGRPRGGGRCCRRAQEGHLPETQGRRGVRELWESGASLEAKWGG